MNHHEVFTVFESSSGGRYFWLVSSSQKAQSRLTKIMGEKIIQIIPADDWFAVFKMDDGEELGDGAELSMPLNCWALFQSDDGSSRVEGIYVDAAGDCTAARSAANFVRYKRLSTVMT
jgi:hypothetical protein